MKILVVLIFIVKWGESAKPCDDGLTLHFETNQSLRFDGDYDTIVDELDALTAAACATLCLRTVGCRVASYEYNDEFCTLYSADVTPPDAEAAKQTRDVHLRKRRSNSFFEEHGFTFLYGIKCVPVTTTAEPATTPPILGDGVERGSLGEPKEPLLEDCPLDDLTFDIVSGADLYQAILGAKTAANQTECANHCYRRGLCSGAEFNGGVCILKSETITRAELGNSSDDLTSGFEASGPIITLIKNISCSSNDDKERSFGYFNPFLSWFNLRYRCYWTGGCLPFGPVFVPQPVIVHPVGVPVRPIYPGPIYPHPHGPVRHNPHIRRTTPPSWWTVRQTHPTFPTQPPTTTPAPLPKCGRPEIPPVVSEFALRSMDAETSRIIGGTMAKPHSWPWQVGMYYYGAQACGGSLIDEYHILTAAHCFKYGTNVNQYQFFLGSHQRRKVDRNEQRLVASHFILHPQYDTPRHANDVAIVVLRQPARLGPSVSPICLAQEEERASTQCVVTGWGDTTRSAKQRVQADVLQQVVVPVVAMDSCNGSRSYKGRIYETMLCAGFDKGGKDSCVGDSGGPLVCADGRGGWRQAGIVSWGSAACGKARRPGVYASVPQLRTWILAQTQKRTQSD